MAARRGHARARHARPVRRAGLASCRGEPSGRSPQPAHRHLASADHRLRVELEPRRRAVRRDQSGGGRPRQRRLPPQPSGPLHRTRRALPRRSARRGAAGALSVPGRAGRPRLHRIRGPAARRRRLSQRHDRRDESAGRRHRGRPAGAHGPAQDLRPARPAPHRAAHRRQRARHLSRRRCRRARARRLDPPRQRRGDQRRASWSRTCAASRTCRDASPART